MSGCLSSSRAKVARAKKHLGDLRDEITAYHAREPYRIVSDKETKPGYELYRVRFVEPIPATLGSIVGDVIHNLRSSLDTLVTGLAEANGVTSRDKLKNTYFPIFASKEVFAEKAPGYIKTISPNARAMIERLKPYKGGTDAFWRLHQLDILDKHSAIIPVGASHTRILWKFNALPGFEAMFADMGGLPPDFVAPDLPPMALTPAQTQFPLRDGDVVFSYGFGPDAEGKFKGEHQFTIDIAFGEGQIIDGQPVVPSLQQLVDFVERVIDIFDRRVVARAGTP